MKDGHVAHTQLRDPWLTVARLAWITTASTILVLFTYGLVIGAGQLRTVCTGAEAACHPDQLDPGLAVLNSQLGFSLDFYAWFRSITFAVFGYTCFGIAWLVFLKRSDDWMALFAALFLTGIGIVNPVPPIAGDLGFMFVTSMLFLFLCLFPDGRFTPRWIRWLLVAWFLLQPFILMTEPDRTRGIYGGPPSPIAQVFFLLGIGSQVYRYFRVSTPVQKQQTKWVVFGTSLWALSVFTIVLSFNLFPPLARPGPIGFAFNRYVFVFVGLLPLLLIPLSIGVSILRFRLWDVDIFIRRSLAYTALTGILTLTYIASVIVFQRILPAQTALATVASTLMIAILFTPFRRRIQGGIDRRFYRRRYDAERTLAEFAARTRDRVELDELEDEFLAVVSGTLEPAFISLWLAPQSKSTHASTLVGESP